MWFLVGFAYGQCKDLLVEKQGVSLSLDNTSNTFQDSLCLNPTSNQTIWKLNNHEICRTTPNKCLIPKHLLEEAIYDLQVTPTSTEVYIFTAKDMPTLLEQLGCTQDHFEDICLSIGDAIPPFGFNSLTPDEEYFSWGIQLQKQASASYILSYFGTWCPPCRKGIPIMDDIATQSPLTTALFFAYNEEKDSDVLAFQTANNIQSRIFVISGDLAQRHGIVNVDNDGELPISILVDYKGNIAAIYSQEGDPTMFRYLLSQDIEFLESQVPEDILSDMTKSFVPESPEETPKRAISNPKIQIQNSPQKRRKIKFR